MRTTQLVILSIIASFATVSAPAQEFAGYSTEPLLVPPLVPFFAVPMQAERYLEQLDARYPKLQEDQYGESRERVFAFVDAIVKQRAVEGTFRFDADKELLHSLFAWAAKLNSYGADQVAAQFAPEGTTEVVHGPEVPAAFRVTLDFPHLKIADAGGAWELAVPFYFPIRQMAQADAGGIASNYVVLNTAFAQLTSQNNIAQSMIIFTHAPHADPEAFDKVWMGRIGVAAINEIDAQIPGSRSFQIDDLRLRVRFELTLLNNETGCYAVLYQGRFGPFEANRVHYHDFLRQMRLAPAPSV